MHLSAIWRTLALLSFKTTTYNLGPVSIRYVHKKLRDQLMDLTREEVFQVLEGMRVEVPRDTKLPREALDQRLIRALDLTQATLKNKVLDPGTMRRWNDIPMSKVSLRDMMGAVSHGEADMLLNSASTPMPITTFILMRAVVAEVGERWNGGSKIVVVENRANTYCVRIHIVDVFAQSDDTPVIVSHYEHGPTMSFRGSIKPGSADHIPATHSTLKLLLKLLRINSKRLATSYNPPTPLRTKGRKIKRIPSNNLTLSFLLPVLPLSMREVGGLSNAAGCEICGKLSVSRCAACQYTAYCSKACQKADWAGAHKAECKKRALASGTWVNIDISTPGYTDEFRTRAPNEFTVINSGGINVKKEDMTIRSPANWPPPNIYGDTPFVVKILGAEPSMGFTPLMVFDRRCSVEFFLHIQADSMGYEALWRTLRQSGYLGQRIFLFAKRTAPTTLSVCLNREPPAELVKW